MKGSDSSSIHDQRPNGTRARQNNLNYTWNWQLHHILFTHTASITRELNIMPSGKVMFGIGQYLSCRAALEEALALRYSDRKPQVQIHLVEQISVFGRKLQSVIFFWFPVLNDIDVSINNDVFSVSQYSGLDIDQTPNSVDVTHTRNFCNGQLWTLDGITVALSVRGAIWWRILSYPSILLADNLAFCY